MELKPCPFCGNSVLDVTFVVRCVTCGAVANLDAWNSRSAQEFADVVRARQTLTITTTGTTIPAFIRRKEKGE